MRAGVVTRSVSIIGLYMEKRSRGGFVALSARGTSGFVFIVVMPILLSSCILMKAC